MLFSRASALLCILSVSLSSCVSSSRRVTTKRQSLIQRAAAYQLVSLTAHVPSLKINLRYGTTDNLTKRPLYPHDMPVLLYANTAERVKVAQAALEARGYGLLIWDAWRPPEVQRQLYAYGGQTGLFLNPDRGWSRHCGGVSIDATLVDREGRELKMPTCFDENLDPALRQPEMVDGDARYHVTLLHEVMRKAGLVPLPGEWWHFDDIDFIHHPTRVVWAHELGLEVHSSAPIGHRAEASSGCSGE
jgi:D-alanyl-D-alanine dipeptidase